MTWKGLFRAQVEGSDSGLAQTLTTHVGKDSPLMRTLDPEATTGLIQQLTQSTETTLVQQKETILKEFSLDKRGRRSQPAGNGVEGQARRSW